ncbi:MAG: hypothetical protein IJX89_02530 [Alphaproteobacteria bacterium]|nr:hypothetical protein [Alphaproteobacteria bacterium]
MKKIYFIVLIFCAQNTYAAIATTYCNAKATYTSCNAGYYLSGGNCVACEKGTYKDSVGTDSSCSDCPSLGGVAGTTSSAGTTSRTLCFIPSDSSVSDSSGTYIFTSDCFYTE